MLLFLSQGWRPGTAKAEPEPNKSSPELESGYDRCRLQAVNAARCVQGNRPRICRGIFPLPQQNPRNATASDLNPKPGDARRLNADRGRVVRTAQVRRQHN